MVVLLTLRVAEAAEAGLDGHICELQLTLRPLYNLLA